MGKIIPNEIDETKKLKEDRVKRYRMITIDSNSTVKVWSENIF